MRTVNIHEAKTHLSRLVAELEDEGEIVIARAGKPVARLVAVVPDTAPRRLGILAGAFIVPDDFDAPLPDGALDEFEG